MQVKPSYGVSPGNKGATTLVAQSVAPGPGVSTLIQRDSLLEAADIFRKAGYHAAAERIEVRARRFSPVVLKS